MNRNRTPESRHAEWLRYKNSPKYTTDKDRRHAYYAVYRAIHREKIREYSKKSKNKRRKELGIAHEARKHGTTPEAIQVLLRRQKGLCAICSVVLIPGRKSHIDHNHKTNKVRAILCRECNLLIGYCRERIDILVSAIGYLQEHEAENWAGLK